MRPPLRKPTAPDPRLRDLVRLERQLEKVRDESRDLGLRYRTGKRLQAVRREILAQRERR
jgi:hypothetical protein